MSLFKRKRRARILPKETGKPLSSRDVLVRLRECWGILSPRRPCKLSDEDIELVGYNMKLAELYNEVRAIEKDGCGQIGFGGGDGGGDNQSGDDEDEEWYFAEVYCRGE